MKFQKTLPRICGGIVCFSLLLAPGLTSSAFADDHQEEPLDDVDFEESEEALAGEILFLPPEDGPVFAYDGVYGPENWGGLSDEWVECSTGTQQSPINIEPFDVKVKKMSRIHFRYKDTPLNVLNNGHTVEFDYEEGSYIGIGDNEYDLLQLHLHSPSEHSFVGGARFPLEIHAVHRDEEGNLAVIAILVKEGKALRTFEDVEFLQKVLPVEADTRIIFPKAELNLKDLLPKKRRYYTYHGSLTTPPCSENVRWLVLKDPIEMSTDQISVLQGVLGSLKYASATGANNRPTQPLEGRKVRLAK